MMRNQVLAISLLRVLRLLGVQPYGWDPWATWTTNATIKWGDQ